MDTKHTNPNTSTHASEKYFEDKGLLASNRTSLDSAPPPYADSLTLHITCDNGWKYTRFSILDTSDQPIYTFHSSYNMLLKPTMSFTNVATDTKVAHLTFPCLSRSIDFTLHDQPLTLKSKSWRKHTYTYSSPSRGGETLTWESQSCWRGATVVVLTGEDGMPIARFMGKHWGRKKGGEIELLGMAQAGEFRDEVVSTGMIVVQKILTNQLGSSSVVVVT